MLQCSTVVDSTVIASKSAVSLCRQLTDLFSEYRSSMRCQQSIGFPCRMPSSLTWSMDDGCNGSPSQDLELIFGQIQHRCRCSRCLFACPYLCPIRFLSPTCFVFQGSRQVVHIERLWLLNQYCQHSQKGDWKEQEAAFDGHRIVPHTNTQSGVWCRAFVVVVWFSVIAGNGEITLISTLASRSTTPVDDLLESQSSPARAFV